MYHLSMCMTYVRRMYSIVYVILQINCLLLTQAKNIQSIFKEENMYPAKNHWLKNI